MNARHQTRLWMSAIAFVMALGQGCGSHTSDYTLDSGSRAQGMDEDGMMMRGTNAGAYDQSGDYVTGRSFYESGESYAPGVIGSPLAYNRAGDPAVPNGMAVPDGMSDGMNVRNGQYGKGGLQYFDPGQGSSSGMSDYGHNYPGVPGNESDHGPVTGFGSGAAEQAANPDPEAWAEAFLRGNGTGAVGSASGYGIDGYADVSQGGQGDGGLVPEQVGQDVLVARAGQQDSPGMYGSNGHARADGQVGASGHYGFSEPYDANGGHMGSSSIMGVGRSHSVQDVYFAFDSWKLTPAGAFSLQADAEWLKANPERHVTIEGHCDQRGTQDYNMVLGKKRAEVAREYLVDLGVKPGQLRVVSYGKERPFCSEHNEYCYQQNRRGHMVVRSQ